MGEINENFLKLTEFPFSYSLMGLLALIFGHGITAPLLILIGFVATTLSICDPVGAIQRHKLKGQELPRGKDLNADRLIFAELFGGDNGILNVFAEIPYLYAIAFSPEAIKTRFNIDWNEVEQSRQRPFTDEKGGTKTYMEELDKIGLGNLKDLSWLLEGLKQQTVKTKWITAEVDRITALIYFMIIISVFIGATLLYPNFIQKFAQNFGEDEPAKIGILIFSIAALVGVIIMLQLRKTGLTKKATVVFRYLTALDAIKLRKEDFETTLKDVERYLNDGHWALAEYWVKRLEIDYLDIFMEEVTKEVK